MKSFVPETEQKLLDWLDELDQESKTAKDAWADSKNWDRYVDLSRGHKIYGDKENPLFRADIASPTVNRKTALLTESEPIPEITSRRPGLDNTCLIIKETITAAWQMQSGQMMLEALRSYMGTMGCGGCRVMWDKHASYGMGDIILPALDPRTSRFDPAIIRTYEMDKAQYIGPLESIRPLAEAQRLFPDKADQLQPSRMVTLVGQVAKKGLWQGLKNAINTATGMSRSAGGTQRAGTGGPIPRVYERQYWVADPATDKRGAPLYPGGRLFIRMGEKGSDCIANFSENPEEDTTANPYFDGLWDVEWLDNIPDLDHPWGRSEIGALRYLQESFNRIGNLVVKNGLRNGFPVVFTPTNALPPDKIAELKDELEWVVIEYQMGRERPVRDQPSISPEIQLAMMQLILTLTDMVTGLGDSGQLPSKGRQEVRSSEQLEGLQNAAQVLVRAEARRLEAFLERVWKKMISRVFQYYLDDRMMTYYGGGENFSKFQFERKRLVVEIQGFAVAKALKEGRRKNGPGVPPSLETIVDAMMLATKGAWRDFDMKIVPLSSLASTKIQRAMLKQQLASAMMIPSVDVLREVGISNPQEKVQEAIEEMQMKQAMGLPPPDQKKSSRSKK